MVEAQTPARISEADARVGGETATGDALAGGVRLTVRRRERREVAMEQDAPAEVTESPRAKPQWWFHAVVGLNALFVLVLLLRTCVRVNGGRMPVESTKVTLRYVVHGLVEYEVETLMAPDHRVLPLETHARIARGQPVPDSWNEQVVETVTKLPKCHAMLKSLGPHAFADADGDGFMEVIDAWGRPLIYVRAVSHTDSFTADDFLRAHPHPYWVSAGADGLFGDARNPSDPALADNLYSDLMD